MLIERQWLRVLGFIVLSIVLLALLTCSILFPSYYMVREVTKLPTAPVFNSETIFNIVTNEEYDDEYITSVFYQDNKEWFDTNVSFEAYDPEIIELVSEETNTFNDGTYILSELPNFLVGFDYDNTKEVNIEINNSILVLKDGNKALSTSAFGKNCISSINIKATNSIVINIANSSAISYVPIESNNSLIISSAPVSEHFDFSTYTNSMYLVGFEKNEYLKRGQAIGTNSYIDLIETTE